jgi:D-glycero-alpha-D-manno-heptose-7-phosphate kinase
MRLRPQIFSKESSVIYSKFQLVRNWEEIQNPLIKEVLKFNGVKDPIEFISFSDIPARTGLGGSSAFCIGMLYLLNQTFNKVQTKKELVVDAIHIERDILKESGGIQDQIWPAYPGFNSISIDKSGQFFVKPVPISDDFLQFLENSMILIYTHSQREQDDIAKSHENKNKTGILEVSKEAYKRFVSEDIKGVGELLYQHWIEKKKISDLISTAFIDEMASDVMGMGAYGVKLLGSGGCGFLLVLCDPLVRKNIVEKYKSEILDFKFEKTGVTQIYP